MAALETIRTKFGIGISVIIAFSLLIFILDNDTLSKWFSGDNTKAHQLAVIDGQSVTIEEFQAQEERIKSLYNGQSSSDVQKAIRDDAWQSFIDKYLFVKNAEAAGIKVGVEELKDLTSGDHISPIIAQNFPDKAMLARFVEENEVGWDYIQDIIRNQQYYTKYNSLFTNSSVITPLMLEKTIEENNVTANVDFVMVPFGYVQDTTVTVSSSEIKKYYKNHKKFYKQNESRDIEYVLVEVVPSASDVAAAEADFNNIYEEFATTDNVKNFLLRNSSEQAYEGYWYKAGELNTINSEVNDFAFGGNAAVSQIIKSGDTFYAARVMAVANRPETVTVKLIPMPEGAETITPEIVADLDATDPMDMTQTMLIDGCEGLFDAAVKVNQPVVVESMRYGKLAAKVTAKSEPVQMKQVAVLAKSAIASKETFSDYYAKANTIVSRSNGKYADFKAAIDTMGYYAHPANNIARNSDKLGAVENTREVANWAFKAKKGQVSDIITVNQSYFFIAALTGIHKEGYAPVDEVAGQIREVLYNEKAGDKKTEEIAERINGMVSLDEIADALGTTVSNREDVAFSSLNSQSLDPAFIGAIASAKEGEVTGPVKGSYGVYVFRVNSRETGSFYTEDDAKAYNDRVMQYSLQTIVPVMMADVDVKDNRARFF